MVNGFPSLHPNLYTIDGQSKLALSSSQLDTLKTTVCAILQEYQNKLEMNQRLMQRVTESDKSGLESSLKANDMALKLAQLQLQLNDRNKQLAKMEDKISLIESEKLDLEKRVFQN